MRTVILVIASLLPIISSFTYIRSIYAGKSVPQRMTRLLLLIITGLSFVSLWADHDSSGVWLALASLIQALAIWVLSFRYGMGGRDRLDIVCLVLCTVGIGLWWVSGEAVIGLIASIVADFIAIVPSLAKTIRLPHTELSLFYEMDIVASVLVLLVGPYTWGAGLYPVYLIFVNALFVLAIRWPRKKETIAITALDKV